MDHFLIEGFNNLIGNIHILYIDNTKSISLSSKVKEENDCHCSEKNICLFVK